MLNLLKHFYLFIHVFLFCIMDAQKNPESIEGYYMAPQMNSIFKCYISDNKVCAKPVWMRYPNRKDSLNPDKEKRNSKILGSVVCWDFIPDGSDCWTKGYIYDSNSGKTYRGKITRDEKGNISIRGYIGFSFIGRTEYFVKVDFNE